MWEENLGTQAGVHLIEGVCLVWGLLNKGSPLVMLLLRPSIDHYAFCESVIVLVYIMATFLLFSNVTMYYAPNWLFKEYFYVCKFIVSETRVSESF